MFAERGVVVTPAALAAVVAANVSEPAGAEVLHAATEIALGAHGAAASEPVVAIAREVLRQMGWMKIRAAAAVAVVCGMVVAAVGGVAASGKSPTTAPAVPAATASAPAPVAKGPAKSPKGTVIAAMETALAGDEEAHIRCFDRPTEQQVAVLRQYVHGGAAAAKLMEATAQRFGPAFKTTLIEPMGMGVDPADVLGAAERINGNTAEVDLGRSGPGAVPLVKVGEVWLIRREVLDALNADMVALTAQHAPEILKVAEAIRDGKYQTIEQAKVAVAQAMGMNPAPAPVAGQPTAIQRLAQVYRLKEGEDLRQVKPPFPGERHQFADTEFPYARGSNNLSSLGFSWNGKEMACTYMQYPTPTLRDVVASGLHVPWYSIEKLDSVKWEPGDGDWIVREPLTIDQRLAALAKIVSTQTGKPLVFQHRVERMACIVLRGETRPAPKNGRGFAVVAVTLEPLAESELKQWIADKRPEDSTHQFDFQGAAKSLRAPFFTERPVRVGDMFYISADARLDRAAPDYRLKLAQVLDNITAQVGGEWTIEDRDIDVWEPVMK